MKKLLITSFPLESNFGGGEKMDLLLSEQFRKKNVEVSFWGTCPVLLKEFRKRKFDVKKAFLVKDVTSIKSLLLSPVYILSLLLQSLSFLPICRQRGFQKIMMLSLIEQIFLTVPAKMLGYDVFWWHHLPPRKPLLKNPFLPIWKFSSRFASIIVSSNFVKSEFEKISLGDVTMLPNAVSFNSAFRSEKPINNSKGQRLRVGMVCRLSPEKGLFEFLKLAKNFPEHDFLVAGEGSLRKDIENFIEKNNLKNFQLLGFIDPDEISKFFNSLDIFCVLSEYESFGIVAAEASFFGVPVLASRVTALPEVILDNKTGLLFEYGNFNDLVEKFKKLVGDAGLRENLGKNGIRYISSKFLTTTFTDTAWKIIFGTDNQQ